MSHSRIANCLSTLAALESEGLFSRLSGITRGLEKECLRVELPCAALAQTPHPPALGANLTHPFITTDFSEAQLEFITTPNTHPAATLRQLHEIHQFAQTVLSRQSEGLWPSSMPCQLPEEAKIPIAEYGSSPLGQLKHIYRQGLSWRYGRRMQTISGVHYNFSFPQDFWRRYHHYLYPKNSPKALHPASDSAQRSVQRSSQHFSKLPDFISDRYFHLIRNALRWRWLLPLWFGASPAVDGSFLTQEQQNAPPIADLRPCPWPCPHPTWISPYATSLRLSDLGYSNTRSHQAIPISFNGLSDFIQGMRLAVSQPHPPFEAIGVCVDGKYRQLNANALQIENEYYGLFRPKRILQRGNRLIRALQNEGVEYLEVRALDLDPFHPLGVSAKALYLLDLFLSACLFLDSPPLNEAENQRHAHNHDRMVLLGRKPGIQFLDAEDRPVTAITLAHPFLELMEALASYFDRAQPGTQHQQAMALARAQILTPEASLSGRVYEAMAQEQASHLSFNLSRLATHQTELSTPALSKAKWAQFEQLTADSLHARNLLETTANPSFEIYLDYYLRLGAASSP